MTQFTLPLTSVSLWSSTRLDFLYRVTNKPSRSYRVNHLAWFPQLDLKSVNLTRSTKQRLDPFKFRAVGLQIPFKEKRRDKNVTATAIAHLLSSANNTILTITDSAGNTKAWTSCGSSGFKGARRKTSYAAQAAAESLGIKCRELGITQIVIRVRGFGPGRESSIRGLHNSGLIITRIQDCTPIPHNGCRPTKRARG